MAVSIPEPVEQVTPGDLADEHALFTRGIRATNNVSPNTILAYGTSLRLDAPSSSTTAVACPRNRACRHIHSDEFV